MSSPAFRIRSFGRRGGRSGPKALNAMDELWQRFGLVIADAPIDYQKTFGREAPTFLEIGFGTGRSLLTLAKANPHHDYIGIETYRPAIASLFLGMAEMELENIRVYNADAFDVLQSAIVDASLAGVQIFFPDPWPKRRHHLRRLIQPEFLKLVSTKLKAAAILHLATDWEDYAKHMMCVLTDANDFQNAFGEKQFADRSLLRPVITKFEQRAILSGRQIWDLQFIKRSY